VRRLIAVLALFVLAGAPSVASAPGGVAGASSGRTNATAIHDPCKDGAYKLEGTRWRSTFEWSFQAKSIPSGMNKSKVEGALIRAARNITWARNDCGLADKVDATQRYLGWAPAAPDITPVASCGAADGKNVIGFGTLPADYLAITCRWLRDGKIVEADVMINKAVFHWVVAIPGACRTEWSVEDVATHEFGHVFGLDHVSEALHPDLTMSPTILPCQMGEATLGLGDIRGLEKLY